MRPEYHLQVNGKDFSLSDYVELGQASLTDNQNLGDAIQVPPLPVRESSVGNVDASSADNELSVANPLLPLPAAEVASHAANVEEIAGRFIANDMIDEGVKLISKFQHGAILEGGPGTRARRSAVKVICIARCPYGSHFATGSDDGICRIWQDEDNSVVERIDAYSEGSSTSPELVLRTCAARRKFEREALNHVCALCSRFVTNMLFSSRHRHDRPTAVHAKGSLECDH